jgi:hypothetical protein
MGARMLLSACVLLALLCLASASTHPSAVRHQQPPVLVSQAQLAEQQRALRDFFNLRLDLNKDGACDLKEVSESRMNWSRFAAVR